MSEPKLPLTGECICGGVRFEVSEPLLGAVLLPLQALPASHRHQRLDHRPHRPGLLPHRSPARIWSVPGTRATAAGSRPSARPAAASSIPTNPENPELLAVRIGALDEDPGIRPGAHQFVTYAAPWAPIPDDGLPRFPERLDPAAIPPNP